jgi:hypothetical protein
VGNTGAASDLVPFEAVRCDTVQGSFHEVWARNGIWEDGHGGRPDIHSLVVGSRFKNLASSRTISGACPIRTP